MPVRKKTPSKIPVSSAWVRRENERRLSRRSGGQSGGADQGGTDHSSPISLPSLSQPSSLQNSPNPALLSQEFGKIGDFIYSNEGTPIGSEISLVSDGSSVTTPVITENPFSIFSPRQAREFDKTQSAPSSPGQSALSVLHLNILGYLPQRGTKCSRHTEKYCEFCFRILALSSHSVRCPSVTIVT